MPEIWRAGELSKLEGPKAAHPGRQLQKERGSQKPLQGTLGENVGESCVVEYDDECDERDYCVPEDESATAKGDYVSLVDNPERFTGYAGMNVWDAIYRENCFSKESQISSAQSRGGSSNIFQAHNDLRNVFQASSLSTELAVDDECLEKRVFHRIISGMHASISTHICFDYLNQTTGTWGPNLQCYQDRLATHPERVSNLYFDYAILLRAVTKLRTYLKNYTFCSGDPSQDAATKSKILSLADAATSHPPIFDENTMFQDPDVSGELKEDFRNRFRNVSRLMDCVGCDKCRLWGKLQTVGYRSQGPLRVRRAQEWRKPAAAAHGAGGSGEHLGQSLQQSDGPQTDARSRRRACLTKEGSKETRPAHRPRPETTTQIQRPSPRQTGHQPRRRRGRNLRPTTSIRLRHLPRGMAHRLAHVLPRPQKLARAAGEVLPDHRVGT